MNPTTQAAIAAAIAAVISSLVTAAMARRGQRGQERIAEWEQWRQDAVTLRDEVSKLRSEIVTLRDEMRSLETRLDKTVAERRELEEQLIDKELRLRHSDTIVGIFVAHLAECLTGDIAVPTPRAISRLVADLKEVGFSAVLPPQATAPQTPIPKAG